MFYVYILRCSDDTLYTGYTTNIERRVLQHNDGRGAKYTRSRRPVTLVFREAYDTKTAALKREYEIKQLTRMDKEALIES